jgi:hypothetical protein
MASNSRRANHGAIQPARLIAASLVLLALVTSSGANAAPGWFGLVLDGRHNASLLHEGSFTSSFAQCASGSAADLSVDSSTDTALRRFNCADGGTFTATISPLPAEHGGNGVWQIVAGSGALANLRGEGTFSSSRLTGRSDDPSTITFRSTWQGVADFDIVAPAIDVVSVTVRKLKRPRGAYRLRATVTFPGDSTVSYVLQVVDPRKPLNALAYKIGRTTNGSLTSTATIKPAKSTRLLRIKVDATDPVGNEAGSAKTVRLR